MAETKRNEAMAELGAKGGRASGEARRKRRRRSIRDAIREQVARDPDAVAERLLSTGASAAVAIRLAGIDSDAEGAVDASFREGGDPRGPRGGTLPHVYLVDIIRVMWEAEPDVLVAVLRQAGVPIETLEEGALRFRVRVPVHPRAAEAGALYAAALAQERIGARANPPAEPPPEPEPYVPDPTCRPDPGWRNRNDELGVAWRWTSRPHGTTPTPEQEQDFYT